MEKEVDIECIEDRGGYDRVYQVTSYAKIPAKFCDCCGELIPDGQSLSHVEDFCIPCFTTGKVKEFYAKLVDEEELVLALKPLKEQYKKHESRTTS